MFKKDQLAHVRAERDILAESDSPWVVKLETTFQDNAYLYMLMEFLPGGDLMTMLIKYEIFSEDITRFYMAEIVLAIEAVHKLGYVHRSVETRSRQSLPPHLFASLPILVSLVYDDACLILFVAGIRHCISSQIATMSSQVTPNLILPGKCLSRACRM